MSQLDKSTSMPHPIASVENHEVFDIFALPRELRDMILTSTLNGSKHVGKHDYLKFQLCNLQTKSLLSVSRQFKQELEDAMTKSVYVLATDEDEHTDCRVIQCGRLLQTPRITLDLVIGCHAYKHNASKEEACRAESEIHCHEASLLGILREFQCFRDLSICLYMRPHHHVEECENEVIKHINKLTSDHEVERRLAALSVYRQEFKGLSGEGWEFLSTPTLSMTWCKASKRLQRVTSGAHDISKETRVIPFESPEASPGHVGDAE